MKIIKTGVLSLGVILAATSCEKYLDVNHDPNATEEASIGNVLAAAEASSAVHIGGELFNLGGFWAQYFTQSPDASQYGEFDEYNISSDFFDRSWTELYAGALKDYQYIRTKASDENNTSFYLVATAMQAYTYQVLADLYDQIPYSEAIQGQDNLVPHYDDGQKVYQGLYDDLNDALNMYKADHAAQGPDGSNDGVFAGDMDKWVRFANTLKLKLMMRSSKASSNPLIGTTADILDLVHGGELLQSDAAFTLFAATETKRNPYFEVNVNFLNGVNQSASQSMVLYLQDNDDARLRAIYDPADADGSYTTKPQGDYKNRDIPNDGLATPKASPTKPVYFFTEAEVNFLQAEAEERFGGGAAAAQPYYEAGIQASFDMYNMGDTASSYYGAGGPYEYNTGGTMEDRIKQIMTQKWVALANVENLEAFFELNRTGYPEFKVRANQQPGDLIYSLASVLGPNRVPKRLLFSDVSKSRNPNVPAQPAGGLSAPVWWDN